MKVALVTSSYLPRRGALERHVYEVAGGLSRRGVEVEVLTQSPPGPLPPVSEFDGFIVRRFAASIGNAQFAVAPGLWEYLHRAAASFDLVHAHSSHLAIALAVARSRPRRFVFTPHVPALRILRWPYNRITRVLIDQAAQIICTAAVEGDALRRLFPSAADRIGVVPHGVDVAALEAARPFPYPGIVLLTVGRLERYKRMDRAIAAMAALDPAFRLAVIGDGPAREKLLAHASDLRVAARVGFVGSVPDAELHRWLRTARVVVTLSERESSGLQVTEALCAGAAVVASDIPVHREAASYTGGNAVKFVPPEGSPLAVVDGIYQATELRVPPDVRSRVPSWDDVVEQTLAAYVASIRDTPGVAFAGGK